MYCYNFLPPSQREVELNDANYKCKDIFRKVSLLANEINLDSTLSLCNLYLYLLYSGNLSINGKFTQETENIKYDGALNLMLGYGCCRNISDGLKSLLNINDIENYQLVTKFNPNLITYKYDPILNEVDNKFDFKISNLFKKYEDSTHILNLVIDEDKYFSYDATWGLILKLNGDKLKVVNGSGRMKILLPDCNFKDYWGKETNKTKEYLNSIEKMEYYSAIEFESAFKNDLVNFKDNDSLIKSFYEDCHSNMEFISEVLKKSPVK